MGGIRSASASAIACVGLAWACGSAGQFVCDDDEQCAGAGADGRCELSGYCSFADHACPSGRRYGERSPDGFAGECVAPGDATVADGGDDGTMSATSPPTLTSDPGETTSDAPLDSSDGGLDDGDGEATTTGEPMEPTCTPTFVDPFDDASLNPLWDEWTEDGATLTESGGRVHFLIPEKPGPDTWPSAGLYTESVSMVGGHVRAELVPFAEPLDAAGTWLTLVDDDKCEVQIYAWNSMILANSADYEVAAMAAQTDAPLWLQLRVDEAWIVYWEWSTDGRTWNELHSEPSPCDVSWAWTSVFAGDEHHYPLPIPREVESFERCEAL